MKAYCQFCKSEGHWGSECPRLKSTSHGAPRVETKQLGAYETAPRVQRRPLVWGPKPTTQTSRITSVTSEPSRAARIAELEAEVKYLKHELAKRVDATAPAVVSPTTSVVSTEGECPVCRKRREARTNSQQKWRAKTMK